MIPVTYVSNGGALRRLRRLREGFPERLEAAAKDLAGAIEDRGAELGRERIERPSADGFVASFDSAVSVAGTHFRIQVWNKVPHVRYVERGRQPGRPVMKAYKNKPGSYVSHYTGMPPKGLFPFPVARKIARDGFEGRHIFATLRREFRNERVREILIRSLQGTRGRLTPTRVR